MRLINNWDECLEHLRQAENKMNISYSGTIERIQNGLCVGCSQCHKPLSERHIHGDGNPEDTYPVPGLCSEGCAIQYAVEHKQLQGVTE